MKAYRYINGFIIAVTALFLTSLALQVRTGPIYDSITVLRTSGMTCSSCTEKIEGALSGIDGIGTVRTDPEKRLVFVNHAAQSIMPEAIAEKLTDMGYTSTVHQVMDPVQFQRMAGNLPAVIPSAQGCCSVSPRGCCSTNL